MSYTAPPNYGSIVPREFDFTVLNDAWELVKAKWTDYGLMGLIVVLVFFVFNFIYSLITVGFTSEAFQGPPLLTSGYFLDLGLSFIGYGVNGILIGGIINYAIRQSRGYQTSLSDFGDGMKNAGSLFIAALVISVLSTIGMLFCCLPGLAIGGLTMMALPLIVDRNVGPFDAISESWRTLQRWWFLTAVFYLAIGVLAGLGVLACIVGIFITMPLMYVCYAVTYMRMTEPLTPVQSASPYPRGPSGQGYGFGEKPAAPPQDAPPPRPEDMS